MTLKEFKAQYKIDTLNFYASKTSSRKIASVGNIKVVTTKDFDAKMPAFIYENSVVADTDTGEVTERLFWISNKDQGASAEFSL